MNLDRRLLRMVRGVRAQFALTIGLGLLSGILLVAQAYALAQTISRAFLGGEALDALWPWLGGLALIALGRALALWGGEVAANAVAGQIKDELRGRLYAHLIALGPAYSRGERSGELANTSVQGVEELDAYFRQYLPQLFLSALVPLAMLLAVLPVDPISAVVLFLTAPLIPFFMILIGLYATERSRAQWGALSRMSAHFLDVLQGLPTLKLFGRSRAEIETIRAISDRFRDTTMSVLRVAFLSALVLELISTLSVAIVAVEIGLRLLHARLDFADA
ncbi:MAG: ABC transporter transmembrane domain-containing protein, partial [Chloroflexota bacterium]